MLSNEIMANPELLMKASKGGANWGFFHEIGHNMQNLNWVFGGTTEVSNNFFSLYMFDRLMGGRRRFAHWCIECKYPENDEEIFCRRCQLREMAKRSLSGLNHVPPDAGRIWMGEL